MKAIERDIYGVISYFSFFGYPVTAFEIWKWQFQPSSSWTLGDIMDTLATSLALRSEVSFWQGHYGIGNVEEQVATRHDYYVEAVKKYRKLRRVLAYVTRIPSVHGVALCNTLPFHFTRPESDIDLFIVAQDQTLWSTRLCAVLPMMILGQRPGEVKKSPVDMSFFVARSALHLQELRLPKGDPYFSHWVQNLVPVYEREQGLFETVLAHNAWAGEDLPHTQAVHRARAFRRRRGTLLPLSFPESWARDLSLWRLPEALKEVANTDSCVVITDDVLKFHRTDRREEIRDHLASCLKNVSST